MCDTETYQQNRKWKTKNSTRDIKQFIVRLSGSHNEYGSHLFGCRCFINTPIRNLWPLAKQNAIVHSCYCCRCLLWSPGATWYYRFGHLLTTVGCYLEHSGKIADMRFIFLNVIYETLLQTYLNQMKWTSKRTTCNGSTRRRLYTKWEKLWENSIKGWFTDTLSDSSIVKRNGWS